VARKLITQAEYARSRNVTRQMVSKEIRQGKYPKHRGCKIDPEEADALLASTRDPARELRKSEPSAATPRTIAPEGFYAARTVREHYAARLAKLEYERECGKLVDVEEVNKSAFEMGRIIRDALLNLPDRLAPILAAESDVHKVHALMMKEIRTRLETLTGHGHA
jgi:hypothetical protein